MTDRKIWSVDLRVWATAYVIADSQEEAEATMRRELLGCELTALEHQGDPPIYGGDFDSEAMPEYSLSPAMTIDPDQPDGWASGIGEAND